MDRDAREVVITIIERLRELERTRTEDMASIQALLLVLCTGNPEFLGRFRAEKAIQLRKLASSPSLAPDDVYDGLIQILRDSMDEGPQGPIQ